MAAFCSACVGINLDFKEVEDESEVFEDAELSVDSRRLPNRGRAALVCSGNSRPGGGYAAALVLVDAKESGRQG